MFASFSLFILIPIFIVASAAVWMAGIQLSNTTDVIETRFNLGQALGGLFFLLLLQIFRKLLLLSVLR